MSKLGAIRILLRNHNYILITEKGYSGVTPRFGHKRYWKESEEIFKKMKKYADKNQLEFKSDE